MQTPEAAVTLVIANPCLSIQNYNSQQACGFAVVGDDYFTAIWGAEVSKGAHRLLCHIMRHQEGADMEFALGPGSFRLHL